MIGRRPGASARRRCGVAGGADDLEARRLLSITPTGQPGEVRTIDGTGNNLADASIGSVNVELLRLASSDYADALDAMAGADRASAREISNSVHDQDGDLLNTGGRSDFLWLWGQFIDHDLDLTEPHEPFEAAPIAVPAGDAHFDPQGSGTATIDFNRSGATHESGVREQLNEITAWIDGSMVYGSDAVRAAALRSFESGRLEVTSLPTGDVLPTNVDGLPNAGGTEDTLFLAGDVRANENVYLTAMHTLWVREHNRVADEIAAADPMLDDEAIYQQARRVVVGQIQAVTYNEWLPALVGTDALDRYRGYDASIDASIANEFSTAAFRLGHSLLPSTLQTVDVEGVATDLELRDAFFRPDRFLQIGLDDLLRGAAAGTASALDAFIVDDLRNFLFGQPGSGGFDLASLNIQRGRDHGLASYNDTREALGLARARDFADVSSDGDVQRRLAAVYDSVDDIDLWTGGLAEDAVGKNAAGSLLGETFHTIVVDQFRRLRDGDRFWYEKDFSKGEADRIGATRLADVINRNTTAELRGNVFVDDAAASPQRDDVIMHDAGRGEFRFGRMNDDGRLTMRRLAAGPGVAVPMFTGDLDGDGHADVVTKNPNGTLVARLVDGRGVREFAVLGEQLGRGSIARQGDFDGDGRDDLVTFDTNTGHWTVHRFDGEGLADAVSERWGRWSSDVPWLDVSVGDVDGDDRDDLVARNGLSGEWFVARSAGFAFETARWGRWSADVPWESVQLGDVDGDGRDDLVGRNPYGGMVYAGLSTGSGFATRALMRLSSAYDWDMLEVGDFNGDGRLDIAARLAHTGAWYCGSMLPDGDATLQTFGRWSADVRWEHLTMADLDGDGFDDLLAVHGETGMMYAAMGGADGFTNLAVGPFAGRRAS